MSNFLLSHKQLPLMSSFVLLFLLFSSFLLRCKQLLLCTDTQLSMCELDWYKLVVIPSKEHFLKYFLKRAVLTKLPEIVTKLNCINTDNFIYDAGPGLSKSAPYNLIFHPRSGLCIVVNSQRKQLELGQCASSDAWHYTRQRQILLKGTKICLQAEGAGKPVKLGSSCRDSRSKWELISASKMHLSSNLTENGDNVCLDITSDGAVVTDRCKCPSLDETCNPDNQWFKIIRSNRGVSSRIFKQLASQFVQVEQLFHGEWRKGWTPLA